MKKLFKLVVALSVFFILLFMIFVFYTNNQEMVTLNLIFYQWAKHPVAIWLLGMFFIGNVLGVLMSTIAILSLKKKLFFSQRQLKQTQSSPDN